EQADLRAMDPGPCREALLAQPPGLPRSQKILAEAPPEIHPGNLPLASRLATVSEHKFVHRYRQNVAERRRSVDSVDQGRGLHAQAPRELQEGFQPGLAQASLDQAHLGAVKIGSEREVFLAQPGFLTLGCEVQAELLSL